MRQLLTVLFAVCMATAANAQNQILVYKVDAENTKVVWKGSKITGSSHTGSVKLKSGTLIETNGQLTSGQMEIDMTSMVNTDLTDPEKNAKLIGHLKSDDFFGVATYPTAMLKIKTFTKSTDPAKGTHVVNADLTIKGITKPVTFYATIKNNSGKYNATAKIVFDRSLYDVRYGSNSFFDNLGDKAISNDIELQVDLVSR